MVASSSSRPATSFASEPMVVARRMASCATLRLEVVLWREAQLSCAAMTAFFATTPLCERAVDTREFSTWYAVNSSGITTSKSCVTGMARPRIKMKCLIRACRLARPALRPERVRPYCGARLRLEDTSAPSHRLQENCTSGRWWMDLGLQVHRFCDDLSCNLRTYLGCKVEQPLT